MANIKRRSSGVKVDLSTLDFKTMNPKANLRPELKEKIEKWILSFYHLDPRYKILTFFNLVASEGADNVTDDQNEQSSFSVIPSNGSSGSNNKSGTINLGEKNGGTDRAPSTPGSSPSPPSARKSPNREAYRVNANLMSRPSARHIRPSTLSLLSSLFNATSILTVWRPCSNDAMRKMMEGTGVGKGLDIKGKSAKKGILSAFVPFMQIFNNDHKEEIQPIWEYAEMRIYYKDVKLRDHVFEVLQKYLKDGPPKKKKNETSMDDSGISPPSEGLETSVVQTVGAQELVDEAIIAAEHEEEANALHSVDEGIEKMSLENGNASDEKEEDDDESESLPPHKDPDSPAYLPEKTKLKKVKKFAKTGFWGIECSQRLFWYATVQDADISRVGTGTETGRPSLPGFQDANHKTLKVAQAQLPKPNPMPVVLQHKTLEDVQKEIEAKKEEAKNESDENDSHPLDGCLDPRFLVMAYEEQGTIKPVVSDFDGFLLGWRREALWFGCNLPRDQESLMMWCVDHIEEILDEQKANPTNSDTWTIRWLDVMKKAAAEGFHIEVPEYGFGDPKSTSIMEHAAMKLKSTGAVRHGSECFNYQFPQEIDEVFLLISDTLKPVPWKYVNVKDLQEILSKKIAEGFVFPLNPKWILCDPGWKKIYDDLMASDALYADLSKDVWFPPYSGIRERIENIHRRHPNGFQRCTDPAIKAKLSHDKSSRTNLSGRRQSATNILRETLDEGLGSELTGNAFADLAQLELDDFVGRNSMMPGKKKLGRPTGAEGSMTIEEIDEDHSSSEAKGPWRTPKRPSHVSHSSDSSYASHKNPAPTSGRSLAFDKGTSAHSSASSTSSKPKNLRRTLIKGIKQSTRNVFNAGKNRSKGNSNANGLGVFAEDDHDSVSESNFNSGINSSSPFPSRPVHPRHQRYVSEPTPTATPEFNEYDDESMSKLKPKEKMQTSKDMNKEPRRHFTKWNKIKQNLKNAKSSSI